MSAIFPAEYMHIGADENNGMAWKLNPAIMAWMSYLKPLFAGNKRLKEVEDHSKNLSAAAMIGLDALDRTDKGIVTDAAWVKQQLDALDGFGKAHSETEIAVITEIAALVTQHLAQEPTAYSAF